MYEGDKPLAEERAARRMPMPPTLARARELGHALEVLHVPGFAYATAYAGPESRDRIELGSRFLDTRSCVDGCSGLWTRR